MLDIAVSFDGSWHRRGNSSHNDLGVVIKLLTGLPIDFQVLSNFCHQCCKSPENDGPNYAEWISNHAAKCSKNYDGSANSVAMYGLRYTCMLCDGDSESYNYIVEREVYGRDVSINEEECINHVSKRIKKSERAVHSKRGVDRWEGKAYK